VKIKGLSKLPEKITEIAGKDLITNWVNRNKIIRVQNHWVTLQMLF
jgi:hypothetical protein